MWSIDEASTREFASALCAAARATFAALNLEKTNSVAKALRAS